MPVRHVSGESLSTRGFRFSPDRVSSSQRPSAARRGRRPLQEELRRRRPCGIQARVCPDRAGHESRGLPLGSAFGPKHGSQQRRAQGRRRGAEQR